MLPMALRLVRVATALVAIAAIVVQAKTLADAGALDLVNFLSFFTIQSNLIGIAVCSSWRCGLRGTRPHWLESLRGAATVYLTITFVVVLLLLQNVDVGCSARGSLRPPPASRSSSSLTSCSTRPSVHLTRRDALELLISRCSGSPTRCSRPLAVWSVPVPRSRAWRLRQVAVHVAGDPRRRCGGLRLLRLAGQPALGRPTGRPRGDVTWLDDLEAGAPDVVATYRNIEAGRFITVRREVRRRTGPGSAPGIVPQLAAIAEALTAMVDRLRRRLRRAGGEGDWSVAQAIGHDAHARAGSRLPGRRCLGRWPADAPAVVPGSRVPRRRPARSSIAGRDQPEGDRAGRPVDRGSRNRSLPAGAPDGRAAALREWLLFAGVHDLMHLEQLQGIEAAFAPAAS